MWPEKPTSFVLLPEDRSGIHFGLFHEQKLVSVVSLFVLENDLQFRKLATLPDVQGRGFGTALLHDVLQRAPSFGRPIIWCNARVLKQDFYRKFGLHAVGEPFERHEMTYVRMEKSLF